MGAFGLDLDITLTFSGDFPELLMTDCKVDAIISEMEESAGSLAQCIAL